MTGRLRLRVRRTKLVLRPQKGYMTLTFDEFQIMFLQSVELMNLMENALELNHIEAAKLNGVLTEPFETPEGVKVQVYGQMAKRGSMILPEFRLVKIKGKASQAGIKNVITK